MMNHAAVSGETANTVLGPVPVTELGVIAIHEALLSVVPGAQYAFDIKIDRAEIFEIIATKLRAFKAAGGGCVVDNTGMFHGRDLKLYESLSSSTGVHIIASTGMGPEEYLGGYFLTPQTNPPTPWPAEKFAELFGKEISDGMVIPRLERRMPAGYVIAVTDESGTSPTEVSLIKGGARSALAGGLTLAIVSGSDPLGDLAQATAEGLPADRIVLAGMDRADFATAIPEAISLGANIALDHVGTEANGHLDDSARVQLVKQLLDGGHGGQLLLSSSAVGVAKGHAATPSDFADLLTGFVPKLRSAGVTDDQIHQLLVSNPQRLLSVGAAGSSSTSGKA